MAGFTLITTKLKEMYQVCAGLGCLLLGRSQSSPISPNCIDTPMSLKLDEVDFVGVLRAVKLTQKLIAGRGRKEVRVRSTVALVDSLP